MAKDFKQKWTQDEHNRYLKAYRKYGKNWTKITELVKSRTCQQVQAHSAGFKTKCKLYPSMDGADIFNLKKKVGKAVVKSFAKPGKPTNLVKHKDCAKPVKKTFSNNDTLFDDEDISSAKLKHCKNFEQKSGSPPQKFDEIKKMEAQAELIALQIQQAKLKIKIDEAQAAVTTKAQTPERKLKSPLKMKRPIEKVTAKIDKKKNSQPKIVHILKKTQQKRLDDGYALKSSAIIQSSQQISEKPDIQAENTDYSEKEYSQQNVVIKGPRRKVVQDSKTKKICPSFSTDILREGGFFDKSHPTALAAQQLVQRINSGSPSVMLPSRQKSVTLQPTQQGRSPVVTVRDVKLPIEIIQGIDKHLTKENRPVYQRHVAGDQSVFGSALLDNPDAQPGVEVRKWYKCKSYMVQGEHRNGRKHGRIVEIDPTDGCIGLCRYKDGKWHGQQTLIDREGYKDVAIYNMGELVSGTNYNPEGNRVV